MSCRDCVLFDTRKRRCDAGYEDRPPSPCPDESHPLGCDCDRCEEDFNAEPAGQDFGSPL